MNWKRLSAIALAALLSSSTLFALEDGEVTSISNDAKEKHHLDKKWHEIFDIKGNFAVGTLNVRGTGGLKNSGDSVYDGHVYTDGVLFLEAQIWDNISFMNEWFVTNGRSFWYFNDHESIAEDDTTKYKKGLNIGEAYLHIQDVIPGRLSLKIGTFDLPFGEEYNWQDKVDNPFVFRTVAWPWAHDQGIMFYGNMTKNWGYVYAINDGDIKEGTDGDSVHPSKSHSLKFYGNITEDLYMSLSYFTQGPAKFPAMWIGNNGFATNSFGTAFKDLTMYEVDLKYSIHNLFSIAVNYGSAKVNYDTSSSNRSLNYFMVQPIYHITDKFYTGLMYSSIKSDEAWNTAIGSDPLGGTLSNLDGRTRAELVFGMIANHNTRYKLSYAQDTFSDTSDAYKDDKKTYIALEAAVKF